MYRGTETAEDDTEWPWTNLANKMVSRFSANTNTMDIPIKSKQSMIIDIFLPNFCD